MALKGLMKNMQQTEKIRHCIRNTPSGVHVLSHVNPVHAIAKYFFVIHFNIILACLSSSDPFSLGFPIKILREFLFCPTRATLPRPTDLS
jgi:hypothetical protein